MESNDQKPNILLITTDQQRFDALGCNKNFYIQTPNLDRLAKEGINFQRHTCSTPLCSPARASIFNGMYSRGHGLWENGYSLPTEIPNLATWLSDVGYQCALIGKSHLEPATRALEEKFDHSKPYYGFHEFHITEDNFVGEYLDWIQQEHPKYFEDALNNVVEGARQIPLPDLGYGKLNAVYTSKLPEELHQTHWITDKAIEYIEYQNINDLPFFVWCSYVDPHHPWNPPEPYASMYDPKELPVPFRLPDDNFGRKTSYSYVEGMQDEEYQRMGAAYYGMITHIDYNIGRLIKTLEEKAILDNTIVIFTSDHGDYNGDRGLIRKAEWMYDGLLRVPLLIRLPGGEYSGEIYNFSTQHEDLAPTILEFLKIPIPESIQGISFSNLLNGKKAPVREFAFYEFEFYRWTKPGNPDLGVAKDDWKLIFRHGNPNGVLTNTAWDPYETQNLFGKAEFNKIQTELTEALFNWIISTSCYRPERPYLW